MKKNNFPINAKFPASKIIYRDKARGVILRPVCPADAPQFVSEIKKSLKELKQFMPWAHYPQTLEFQIERCIKAQYSYLTGQDLSLIILDEKSGRFIGSCGLHKRVLNPKGYEIGYWITTKETGKGYATLITQVLSYFAIEVLGAERVQVGHDEFNHPSKRVIEKCEFPLEGYLKNFIPSPSKVARGYKGNGTLILYGLTNTDLKNKSWFKSVGKKLRFKSILDK